MTTIDEDATLFAQLSDAGYSAEQVVRGLEYAEAMGATTMDERGSFAVSRIMYSNAQLVAGAHFEWVGA